MQESIITGLVADGAIEQTVPASLCSVELLAPWVSTNEVSASILVDSHLVNIKKEWNGLTKRAALSDKDSSPSCRLGRRC
jgi:hypothetical protein